MVVGRLIRLTSKNVFTNLAAEERLFQRTSGRSLLFYVNSECAVLGRTQNPFKEVDVAYAAEHRIPIARRRSGGGTVVHDEGNLNFCFMRPREEHEPLSNARLIASVLREEFGIIAQVNDRADILVDGKKVSGAAYRLSGSRAYHHGTLLINANLDRLRRLLKSPLKDGIKALGAQSVPSPVTNLCDHYDGDINTNLVIDAIAERFSRTNANVQSLSVAHVERDYGGMQAERGELCSHAWTYGKIPRFSYEYQIGDMSVKFEIAKGAGISDIVVKSVNGVTDEQGLARLEKKLKKHIIGMPFDGPFIARSLSKADLSKSMGKVIAALHDDIPGQFWRYDAEAMSKIYN